ncbi:uncharacterized protein [Porites lutea]|uniref:uncharacterized protein n=1 Tax=Porites lutea TaxID=51062 RepID=UPI003CC60D9B
MACRRKVQRHLVNQFRTLEEAEDFYKIDYFEGQQEESSAAAGKATSTPIKSPLRNLSGNLSPIFNQSPLKNVTPEFSTGDLIKLMMNGFLKMTRLQREQFLSYLFCIHLSHDVGINDGYVPANFLQLAGSSFKNLQVAGKENTLYFLARSVGESRPGGSGPRMSLDRMPFGLIHHNLQFFAKDNVSNLHPCEHYAEWLTTMFAHFGHKWDKLYRGPMWSYDGDSSDEEGDVPPFLEPQISQSLHNVITQESEEPTSTSFNRPFDEMGDLLSQAVRETEGLEELMCNTGTQDIEPSSEISTLWSGLSVSDMAELEQASDSPLQIEQLHNARPSRTRKHKHAKRDPLKAKVNVVGLSSRQLQRRIQQKGFTRDTSIQIEALKTAKQRNPNGRWWIKADACDIREAATHLMIFMVADERRDMKPYAIPVRALPFKSITDAKVRQLRDDLKLEMENLGMVVVGFVTDGEFNSLRTKGSQRPVSVIQLMADAKSKAKSIPASRIARYLTPKNKDGAVEPQVPHPAVPIKDVVLLKSLMDDGLSFTSALRLLRRIHFPFNYDPHPWKPGKPENKTECLKSLMATYLYRKKVNDYCALGVNFKEHLYVPELNEVNGETFHEREDHNHVLKRITSCARAGTIPSIGLQYFRDALHDENSGMIYEALTGKRKQSVPDCEKFFSIGVLKFLQNNNHKNEARVVEIILNWHKANDGRGLSEEERRKYNLAVLDWILEAWMPWYWYCRDYSKQ